MDMAHFSTGMTAWAVALGAGAALLFSAPASADPVEDPAPPPPAPVAVEAAEAAPATPLPSEPSGPAPGSIQTVAEQPTVDHGVSHLSSPQNLPPGTTEQRPADGPRLTYWRELWHAYQTQEVSGGDALLLLAQRPMSATSLPPAGMPAGPQAPLAPASAPGPVGPPPVDPASEPAPTP